MPYLVVEDFRAGMDRTRDRVAGKPGTLWLGKNVHIKRGGDIERRKKFTADYAVPGTFGVASLRSQLYVFGSADLAASMPIGVQYQRLQAPGSPAMTALLDVKSFRGELYAIAEYADGSVYHFLDGTRVSDWDVIAAAMGSLSTVAEALSAKIEFDDDVTASVSGAVITITARTAGTAFTITKSTTDGGGTADQDITLATAQANVAAVTEVLATATITIQAGTNDPGTNTISSILVNDEELLSGAVDWSGSNATTAIRLAQAITNGFNMHGYSAEASGDVVTISAAPGTGTTPNGYEVEVFVTGDVTVSADATMSGGVAEVDAVAQVVTATISGTFEEDDTFVITINGTDYKVTGLASGTGRSVFVSNQHMFSPVGSLWRYCMLNRGDIWDPANATADNDAGFVNVASETEGNENLVTAARYQGLGAVFSPSTITLYDLDVDPANFAYSDSLDNTGTSAAASPVRYGNNDVFYLDITGIRSLRARDSSNAPFVSDVGNAIDTFVQEYVDSISQKRAHAAVGAIEPRDGRLWMAVGARIFVLSYFPGSKITAWTYYEPDEFNDNDVQGIVRVGNRLHVRAGDNIFTYGGLDGDEYPAEDEAVAEVHLPFLAGKTAGTIKGLKGFDVACTNTWECEVAFDPNDTDKTINIGRLRRTTFADPNSIDIPGETSMIAPKLVCRKAGAATLSMLAVHYDAEAAH